MARDGVNYAKSLGHAPERCVVSVKVRGFACHDKELGATTVAPRVRHGKYSAPVVEGVQFTGDSMTRIAGSCAKWTAALNHECFADPVENQTVIKTLVCEVDKVSYCVWGDVVVKFDDY